jgi:hypothetical protein
VVTRVAFSGSLYFQRGSESCPGQGTGAARYDAVVERLTKADQVCTVAVAAAHDLNNELTVILNSVAVSILALEPGHPARYPLLDLQRAAERCARKASGLLSFGARNGARPVHAPFENLARW